MILLLFEYPTLCGGEQSLLCLLPALQDAGCRFVAAAPRHGPLADALAHLGIEVVPLLLHDDCGVRRPLAQCREELTAVVRRCQPELLHANSLAMARLSGPVAAAGKVPSVGHIRDIVRLSQQATRDVNCHSRLLAVSQATAAFHAEQGIDTSRIHVLYNGIDLNLFRPQPGTGYLHRELGVGSDARLIGSIGQIGPRKGLDLLLDAAVEVVREIPESHFVIVGQRLSRKAESELFECDVRAKAAKSPIAGHVHFLGWRSDVPDLLRELTLLVHPARQEPLGRVLLEAAASGCPVVASAVGGTSEIFSRPSPYVHLLAEVDFRSLAAAILTALNLDHSPAARVCSQVIYGIEDTAQRLLAHWHEVEAGFRAWNRDAQAQE